MSIEKKRITVASWLLLALIVSLAACNKSDNSSVKLFASPEHSYTKELLASVRSVESILLERSA